VTLDLFRSGRPTDNAFIESLNGKFRAECLNQQWFINLDDAVRKCDAVRRGAADRRLLLTGADGLTASIEAWLGLSPFAKTRPVEAIAAG